MALRLGDKELDKVNDLVRLHRRAAAALEWLFCELDKLSSGLSGDDLASLLSDSPEEGWSYELEDYGTAVAVIVTAPTEELAQLAVPVEELPPGLSLEPNQAVIWLNKP